MPLSVRLDARTESLIGRLARKRRQTKSEVIRDAIGALAKQEETGAGKKRPYDLVAHLIGCIKGGPHDLSVRTGEKFRQMLVSAAVNAVESGQPTALYRPGSTSARSGFG